MTRVLTCETFHDGHVLRGPTRIELDEDTIVEIAPHDGPCEYALVAPGLVDLQMNGWDDVDVADAPLSDLERLGSTLAGLGTTSWLATIITAPRDALDERIRRLDDAHRSGRVPGLVGMHLEGPFLGRSPGAHPRAHIIDADIDWLEALPPSVRLVTLAAETANAEAAIALLTRRGISVSIGHSSPTRAEFDAAIAAGAASVTHLFNGMSGIHHREGGLALWALTTPGLAMGVIADMVHVSPDAVALAFLSDRGARPYLVSDSVAWQTPWAHRRRIAVVDGAPRLPDGTLAGSATCLADGVRRAVQAGVDRSAALASATSRPARLIGQSTLGTLVPGGPADLVVFEEDVRIVDVLSRLPSGRA